MTTVERPPALTESDASAVLNLIAAATETDRSGPLSEAGRLRLTSVDVVHLVVRGEPGGIVGYAQVDADESAELVVHPSVRRAGIGRRLLVAAIQAGARRVWAHNEHPGALALAASLGMERARVLWQLRRPLSLPLPEPKLPADVRVRTFAVGDDDSAWLKLNAAAFSHHPEQGGWTEQDLTARFAEPWFDPAGFFLAESAAGLLGFHWTKAHSRTLGEIYVLGVSPQAQGIGLAKALSIIGLAYLRDTGHTDAMLYVEEDNEPAVGLYRRLGFENATSDVMFQVR
ncbi:mycothiol synthase [Fodinicola feengrottensis]|uniref:Mycothiol acetyltransferase n=1 Tax=Fodinicola feengrottensis TaxID=435914 RepID=A0ABN2I4K8_9ACTN|nr:mycothiol synthase [Fodinicola feengrottensis]